MKTLSFIFAALFGALLLVACERDTFGEFPTPQDEVTYRDAVKTVPFSGHFVGTALPDSEPLACFLPDENPGLFLPAEYSLDGMATHLGNIRAEGSSLTGSNCSLDPVESTISYDLELVVTAANGDQIVFHTRCVTSLIEGTTNGEWTVDGSQSTGRFAGASGSGINFGRVDPSDPANVSYDSNFRGVISTVGSIK